MEHSELFLLLPKYKEVKGQPNYINEKDIMSESEVLEFIEGIDKICRFLEIENYEGFYDADNISAFMYPVEKMKECYPNILTRMYIVMRKWGENWRTQKVQKNSECYKYYCLPIKDDTLCEITERKFVSTDESTFLLINYDAFSCSSQTVMTTRNQDGVELDVCAADISYILKWYETNRRPQRVFNLNPKHGENGKGAHSKHGGKKVSVLMCSSGEAREMLLKAIGTDQKVLYFFDKKNEQYVEFKRESENTYHGFHLNVDDEERVPNNIKKMIKVLI